MSNPSSAINPFSIWLDCANSMVQSSLKMAVDTASSTTSMWGGKLPPAALVEPVAPSMPAVLRHAPAAMERQPVANVDKPQSWYRAPYRSPFDPMFWLEPDTSSKGPLPWMSGIAGAGFQGPGFMGAGTPGLAQGAGSAFGWPGLNGFGTNGSSMPMAAGMQMFGPAMFGPGMFGPGLFGKTMSGSGMFGSGMFGAGSPFFAPFASMWSMPGADAGGAALPALMKQAWQPMMSCWLAMLPGAGVNAAQSAPMAPVIDAMGSAYRSMGGFAVAQAFMDTAARASPPSQPAPAHTATAGVANPWVDLFFPWMKR